MDGRTSCPSCRAHVVKIDPGRYTYAARIAAHVNICARVVGAFCALGLCRVLTSVFGAAGRCRSVRPTPAVAVPPLPAVRSEFARATVGSVSAFGCGADATAQASVPRTCVEAACGCSLVARKSDKLVETYCATGDYKRRAVYEQGLVHHWCVKGLRS